MEWTKVLVRHVLFEYTDFSDSEFRAWIKIMALTAELEHEPTDEQMLSFVHHKTLKSVQEKLKKHSTTLQEVLKKVLKDVQGVVIERNYWKSKKKKYREVNENVHGDVHGSFQGQSRVEKSRVEKSRYKESIPPDEPAPPQPENTDEKITPKGGVKRKPVLTTLPENFCVSGRVQKWADERQIGNLEEHLESFLLKCSAKEYRYANWDSAFMTAIRDNWAGIGMRRGNDQPEQHAKVANTKAYGVISNWRPKE